MNKAKIAKIFFSLQGEGPYVGTPQIFIRFFGCNIKCRFCDTRLKYYKKYDVLSLRREIDWRLKKYKAKYVSLTGGEPLLQVDFIYDFLKKARFKKQFVYLETNGILFDNFKRIKEYIDIVAMDIKLPSATGGGDFWFEHQNFIEACSGKNIFLKVVITRSAKFEDVKKAAMLIKGFDRNTTFVLQPNHSELGVTLMKKIIDFQMLVRKFLPDVRVIPQVHKILGLC